MRIERKRRQRKVEEDGFVDLCHVISEIIPSLDAMSRTVFDLIYLDMNIEY